MPPKSVWSIDQRKRLIELIRHRHEVLWKPMKAADRQHQNMSALRREAFEQIQTHFEADGFSVDDIFAQWRNLKDIFQKRMKETVQRARAYGKPVPRPRWRFFEALSFLASPKELDEMRLLTEGKKPAAGNWHQNLDKIPGSSTMMEHGQIAGELMLEVEEQPQHEMKQEQNAINLDDEEQINGFYQNADEVQQQLRKAAFLQPRMMMIRPDHIRPPQLPPVLPHASTSSAYPYPSPDVSTAAGQLPCSSSSSSNATNVLASAAAESTATAAAGDRFKFFGVFVESAVRDLNHQSPAMARRLLHNIYATIAEHQMQSAAEMGEE